MLWRIFFTLFFLMVVGTVGFFFNIHASLIMSEQAGNQFLNSDSAYLQTQSVFYSVHLINMMLSAGTFIILACVWGSYLLRNYKNLLGLFIVLGLGAFAIHPEKAFAFAETTDRTEVIPILPNETAFWIPNNGSNKDSQMSFDSEDYLKDNKVPTKPFEIKHAKLSGTGGISSFSLGWSDYYVPVGRLILVKRTPYSKVWVAAKDRGTNVTDQGQHCQSIEGIDVTTGITLGAIVKENNAAKYLYNFGVVEPTGDRSDPKFIYQSVYYGQPLDYVMENVVFHKVTSLICDEVSIRSFNKVNADQKQIMENVEKNLTAYLDSVGITLKFIGWADTFTFDPNIQKAINDKYIAENLNSSVPTLEALTQLKVQEGIAKGIEVHGMPFVVTPDILSAFMKIGQAIPSTNMQPPAPAAK